VTYGVVLYQVIWALPLALWSAISPQWGALAGTLAVAPAVVYTLRYGPLLSRD
jgi:hypothetical protein